MLGSEHCESILGLFFFFQAEDGIRDLTVTGVQTCALPILDDGRVVGRRVVVGWRRAVVHRGWRVDDDGSGDHPEGNDGSEEGAMNERAMNRDRKSVV